MKKLFLCLVLFFASSSLADSFQIIRDSEIENNLKAFMEPLVKAAKLNPQNINIIILADPSLNAFVTNGTDMFINSGLIIKFADDPNVLYGVMAHEIAHILHHLDEKNTFFLDNFREEEVNDLETEANQLAAEKLKHQEIITYLKTKITITKIFFFY